MMQAHTNRNGRYDAPTAADIEALYDELCWRDDRIITLEAEVASLRRFGPLRRFDRVRRSGLLTPPIPRSSDATTDDL